MESKVTESKSVHILCMEDDAGVARLLAKRLEREGYTVDCAGNGEEGLAKYAAHNYDVLLLDAHMPVMGGVEVLRVLAERGDKKPVIMVTGTGDETIAVDALKTGASDYLIKDVDGRYFDLLPSVIQRVLVQRRLQIEKEQAIEALRESEERFRGIIESTHDYYWALAISDPHDFSKAVVAHGSHGLGVPLHEDMNQKAVDVVRPFHADWSWNNLEESCLKVFSTGQVISDIQMALVNAGGTEYLESEIFPLKKAGKIIGVQGLSADITSRKRLEAINRRNADELKRSNRDLESFAFVASHDLQEPLRKIAAFGERVMNGYRDVLDDRGRDYLDRILSATRRMQALIHDLLQLSRVGAKAQPFESVDIGRLMTEVLSNLETYMAESGGQVIVERDLPTLEADANQMYQLFQNLIGNALKFRKKGVAPIVKMSARKDPVSHGFWQILVEDNGIGFDEASLARIFNPFERLHSRSEYEGTGLGLAICHRIVTRHGGSITAKSQQDQGTAFIVTLPEKQSV